jgi:hypothetical protein
MLAVRFGMARALARADSRGVYNRLEGDTFLTKGWTPVSSLYAIGGCTNSVAIYLPLVLVLIDSITLLGVMGCSSAETYSNGRGLAEFKDSQERTRPS